MALFLKPKAQTVKTLHKPTGKKFPPFTKDKRLKKNSMVISIQEMKEYTPGGIGKENLSFRCTTNMKCAPK
jgi:hypothetical protein